MNLYQEKYLSSKFHVAVDCIVFGYENKKLKILLCKRMLEPAMGEYSLMGGWINDTETVEQAAERVLLQITGLKDKNLEMVGVFSDPGRDPGGRVISVVFYAMIRIDKHDRELVEKHGAEWWSFEKRPKLIFDHDEMIEMAHNKLKEKANSEIIGKKLLPSRFTIFQLRTLYEAILQSKIDPANFRKKVLLSEILEKQTEKNKTESKKGAFYYRFR